MEEIVKYPNCFVCGDLNEKGLRAKFYRDGDLAIARLETTPDFEGYRGIYHGGIVSSMLDEVMIKAILAQGIYAVTAELTIRFRKPIGIGIELQFSGEIVQRKGRMYITRGSVFGVDQVEYATATGKYVEAGHDLKHQLMQSIPKA